MREDAAMIQPGQKGPLQVLFLTLTTLVAGVFGSCVGFIWGLSTPLLSGDAGGTFLWTMGWTAIGAIQGACVAAAFHLGRAAALRPSCRLILATGGLGTSVVALSLWRALGAGATLSLAMAMGLSIMCAAPLCAHLFSRRQLAPGLPV